MCCPSSGFLAKSDVKDITTDLRLLLWRVIPPISTALLLRIILLNYCYCLWLLHVLLDDWGSIHDFCPLIMDRL